MISPNLVSSASVSFLAPEFLAFLFYWFGLVLEFAEAVQVLVSSLADESPLVREASMASLKDIATLYLSLSLSKGMLV